MKKGNLSIVLIILLTNPADPTFAQASYSIVSDSSGIYLTYNDFKRGKLTDGFRRFESGYSVWPQGFFTNKDVELKTPDTSLVYKSSEIWGYIDHMGRLIRLFDNTHYYVRCDQGLVIYSIYSPTKKSNFFSKTLNAPLYRLTRKNLISQYVEHQGFSQRVKSLKKKYWLLWDEENDCYFLNRLFSDLKCR